MKHCKNCKYYDTTKSRYNNLPATDICTHTLCTRVRDNFLECSTYYLGCEYARKEGPCGPEASLYKPSLMYKLFRI